MGKCKFCWCDQFAVCERKDDPWKDNKCCEIYNKYIQQDQVAQRETPFIYLGDHVQKITDENTVYKKSKQSKNNLIFQLYFIDHKKVKDIAIHAECPAITIYKFIAKVKKRYIK